MRPGFSPRPPIDQANRGSRGIKRQFKEDSRGRNSRKSRGEERRITKPEAKNRSLNNGARARPGGGVNGVYVMVCMNPSHLQVEVGRRDEEEGVHLDGP